MINIDYKNKKIDEYSLLTIRKCGERECVSSHCYEAMTRNHFLIHFIVSGSGTFYNKTGVHKINKGQGFLIAPNEMTKYVADEHDPWHYVWVGFGGVGAKWIVDGLNVTNTNPVFSCNDVEKGYKFFKNLITCASLPTYSFYGTVANIFHFLSLVERPISKSRNQEIVADCAATFINDNYINDIKISDVAKYVNIDRSHFYRIFSDRYGMSPQQYLITIRISKARLMLLNSDDNISNICYACGFKDIPHFSRIFKEKTGMSPSEFRIHPFIDSTLHF